MKEILIIGVVQCALFLFLNLQKKNKQKHDWILNVWLFGYFLQLFLLLFYEFITPNDYFIVTLTRTISICYAPLILIYIQSLFKGNYPKRLYLHFLPFVFVFFAAFLVKDSPKELYKTIMLSVKAIVHFGYPIATLVVLKSEIEKKKRERSDDFVFKLIWIKIVAYLLLISASLLALNIIMSSVLDVPFNKLIDIIRFIMITIIIGYYGLKFGIFFSVEKESKKDVHKRYKHSPIKNEEKELLKSKIEDFFSNSDAYLDTEFSLDKLSYILEYPKHYLSEIISKELESSFYELVNSNRVHFAQERIKNDTSQKLTLEAIGYESGFNSKSAFFRHFKNYTGKTPRQFKIEISAN